MKMQTHDNATPISERSFSEWVKNDPRSVHAMLRGHGDDRGVRYERYSVAMRRNDPQVTEEQLVDQYPDYIRQQEKSWRRRCLRALKASLYVTQQGYLHTGTRYRVCSAIVVRAVLSASVGLGLVLTWLAHKP